MTFKFFVSILSIWFIKNLGLNQWKINSTSESIRTLVSKWLTPRRRAAAAACASGKLAHFSDWSRSRGSSLGAVHKRRRQLGGGGVKNWPKLPTMSTKKQPTWGRGVLNIQKNYRRRLWMTPVRSGHLEAWGLLVVSGL